jgi:hypothetical protein
MSKLFSFSNLSNLTNLTNLALPIVDYVQGSLHNTYKSIYSSFKPEEELRSRFNNINELYDHFDKELKWSFPQPGLTISTYNVEILVGNPIRSHHYEMIKELFLPEYGISINNESDGNIFLNSNPITRYSKNKNFDGLEHKAILLNSKFYDPSDEYAKKVFELLSSYIRFAYNKKSIDELV